MAEEEEYEVSWQAIHSGQEVVSSDGKTVGHVTHPLGDLSEDVFDGVGFKHSLFAHAVMAKAKQIARITNKKVYLAISAADCEGLPRYSEEQIFRVGELGFFGHPIREVWRKEKD